MRAPLCPCGHSLSLPLVAAALLLACLSANAGGILRIEQVAAPRAVVAGGEVQVTVSLSVVEAVRDGMRAGLRLVPVEEGDTYPLGPVASPFNAGSAVGTAGSLNFTVSIPEAAARGTYRLLLQHYDRVEDRWVRSRLANADGDALAGDVVGELRVVEAPPPPADPPPLRRLEPGEIARTFECEDFDGMDGDGEDLAGARGWTWYSRMGLSGWRAAANTTGRGTIFTQVDPPLPPGEYQVFLNATTPGSTVRVVLGDAEAVVDILRRGWNPGVELSPSAPVSRLAVEAVNKVGPYIILDSIHVTNIPDAVATAGVDPARQYLPPDARPTKTGRTIWTPEFLAGARERVGRYPSVRESAEALTARAQELAARSDEELWNLLGDTRITRPYWVNESAPCPNCGHRGGRYVWEVVDPFEHPYKVKCPACEMQFPSNDFASGDLTSGEFPDDGDGYRDGDQVYRFIGYYVHWAYRSHYLAHLRTLTEAVALTDDPELAHKLGVMLIRAAQQYPNSEDRHRQTFTGQAGYVSGGVTDRIWSSYDGRTFGQAYDALWPFIDGNERLLDLARRELPGVETGEDLRLHMEENLLRRIGQMYCDGGIQGNAGYHQTGMAWLVMALGDRDSGRFPDVMDLLEFLYYRISGPVAHFPEVLMRDGSSLEATGYNASRLNMVEALDVLERFFRGQGRDIPRDRFPSVWEDPRFAAQFDYYTDYVLLDRWMPAVGNSTGGPVVPERTPPGRLSVVSPRVALWAWQHYRTPRLARLAYGWEDEAPAPSLWEDRPLEELALARQDPEAEIRRETHLQDAYGLAFLRSGSGDNARELCVWYGALLSHAHDDQLYWELAGKGLHLLPDLGYPRSWGAAGRWEGHSLTHNTVTVEGPWHYPPRGRAQPRGRANLLGTIRGDNGPPPLQLVEVEGGEAGTGTNVARRVLALVDLDEEDFYVLDVFDVRGGTSHTLSYHGPQAQVATGGVELAPQERGTVAGEDVEYGQPVVDEDGTETHTPLAHMVDVERGEPTGPFFVNYALGDAEETHLRLTMFPEDDTRLVLGTGLPPVPPEDYRLRYALQMREGPAPLTGRHVTVVEPHSGARKVTDITRVVAGGFGGAEALQITTEAGHDTLIVASDADTECITGDIFFTGRAALVRTAGDTVQSVVAYGFTSLEAPGVLLTADAPYMEGTISACDYENWSVTVPGIPPSEALVGQAARVFNDLRSTLHIITAVEPAGDGARLTFSTSALVHRGIATGIGNATLRDAMPSPWALESFMAGTRMVNEAGDASWMVRTAFGGWYAALPGTRIDLVRGNPRFPASEGDLRAGLTDVTGDGRAGFTLYEYGPGDGVQVANYAWLTRGPQGAWAGVTAPSVTVAAER